MEKSLIKEERVDKITAMMISSGLGLIAGNQLGTKHATAVVVVGIGLVFAGAVVRVWLLRARTRT